MIVALMKVMASTATISDTRLSILAIGDEVNTVDTIQVVVKCIAALHNPSRTAEAAASNQLEERTS